MIFIIAVLLIAGSVYMYYNSKKLGLALKSKLYILGAALGGLLVLYKIFTVVPAGSVGVVDFLGNVSDNTLKSGVNLVNPMANVILFSIKTQ